MSAAPQYLGLPMQSHESRKPESRPDSEEHSQQTFWQWFAVGVLIFCWIAEATLCAERGF